MKNNNKIAPKPNTGEENWEDDWDDKGGNPKPKWVKKAEKNPSREIALDEYSSSAGYGGWGHDE
jgi:hypothetical protein